MNASSEAISDSKQKINNREMNTASCSLNNTVKNRVMISTAANSTLIAPKIIETCISRARRYRMAIWPSSRMRSASPALRSSG